jgi:uncharacterized membrane protein
MLELVYGIVVILVLICVPFFISSISKPVKNSKLTQYKYESDEEFAARQEEADIQQAHRDAWVADVLSIKPSKKDTLE